MQSTCTKHSVLFLCHSCFVTYHKDKLSFGIRTGNVNSGRMQVLANETNFSYLYTKLVSFGWQMGLKFVIPCYFFFFSLKLVCHSTLSNRICQSPWLVPGMTDISHLRSASSLTVSALQETKAD